MASKANHTEEAVDGEEEPKEEEQPAEKTKKHDSGAADLEKVTDYEEEKEILSEDIKNAMTKIGNQLSEERQQKLDKEKELAKVVIKKEDVELIMREMEITKMCAERCLREHQGNIVQALVELTN